MTTPASTPTTRCVAGIPLLCCTGPCFASSSTTAPCWPSKSWTELEIGVEDVTEKIASLMNLCVINDEKKLLGEAPKEIRLVPLLLPLPSLLLFLLSSYPYAPPRVYSSLHRVFLALTVTVAPPQQLATTELELDGQRDADACSGGRCGGSDIRGRCCLCLHSVPSLAKVAPAPPTPTALASETSTAAAKD